MDEKALALTFEENVPVVGQAMVLEAIDILYNLKTLEYIDPSQWHLSEHWCEEVPKFLGKLLPKEYILRVHLSETSMDLPAEKRAQLQNAFIKACIGQVYDNKAIKEVRVNEFKAKYWGSNLDFTGDIVFEDGSTHKDFEAHLYRDGFGGYEGFVRTKGGGHLIVKDIRIE